jgi:hypothetical protein
MVHEVSWQGCLPLSLLSHSEVLVPYACPNGLSTICEERTHLTVKKQKLQGDK